MTLHWRKELIESCKRGSRHAQQELYEQYKDAMYNVAYRMTQNTHDAEDILVSSFTDVFRNINSYDFRATPGAWIKRIVINNSITHLNKKKVDLVFFEVQPEVVEEPHLEVEELVSTDLIKDCITELPDGYRTVLTLYLIEGYDHNEIGTVLGVTTATSKSQYSRARKKLKEIIKGQLSQTA
ncbi:MAG: RNA polymerase sigma factor (sigma-70 family) [Saprospiraceae bacterium]|jgi:RNA polymerase sigma factor (sigma-70 family)